MEGCLDWSKLVRSQRGLTRLSLPRRSMSQGRQGGSLAQSQLLSIPIDWNYITIATTHSLEYNKSFVLPFIKSNATNP